MKPDARFRYALAALHRKRDWELEAERLALAQATHAVDLAEERLEALRVRFATARADATARARRAEAFHAQAQQVSSAYFASLVAAIEAAAAELERLKADRKEAMQRVLEASAQFAAVDRHRTHAREEHARDAERRQLASMDEGWMHRHAKGEST